jgi:hypothetical protein
VLAVQVAKISDCALIHLLCEELELLCLSVAGAQAKARPHAAFCFKAAARCERALEDPTAEVDTLVQAAQLFAQAGISSNVVRSCSVPVPFLCRSCGLVRQRYHPWVGLTSTLG